MHAYHVEHDRDQIFPENQLCHFEEEFDSFDEQVDEGEEVSVAIFTQGHDSGR